MPLEFDPEAPYRDFHESVGRELNAMKDRIRSIVRFPPNDDTLDEEEARFRSHWLTDGEWKESILRNVLRRHLQDAAPIGRGFVVDDKWSSSQIDILIPRRGAPTLFRDGDLFVLTPSAVSAVAEVKTNLASDNDIREAVLKLAMIGEHAKPRLQEEPGTGKSPWLGLFVYEGDLRKLDIYLQAVAEAYRETQTAINCISIGESAFIRFWDSCEWEIGDSAEEQQNALWRSYELPSLAASYFVGNIVDHVCGNESERMDPGWFAYAAGKRGGASFRNQKWLRDFSLAGEDGGMR